MEIGCPSNRDCNIEQSESYLTDNIFYLQMNLMFSRQDNLHRGPNPCAVDSKICCCLGEFRSLLRWLALVGVVRGAFRALALSVLLFINLPLQ